MTTEDCEMKLFLICTNYWDTADADMWMVLLRKWKRRKTRISTDRTDDTLCSINI